MENKINIAEILRDMPEDTKLYSPMYGKCEFGELLNDKEYPIGVYLENKESRRAFTKDGHYLYEIEGSECILFPSAKMRDWSKFFKRGDVVVNEYTGLITVFNGWVSDDYTEFNTAINFYKKSIIWGKEDICCTLLFRKATNEERAEFIAAVEKHYGGKYNPETLQVEPAKSKRPFEPFQKVLVRDDVDDVWHADYFSHYEEDDEIAPYVCVGCYYKLCIPYEGSEHLLGTDKSPE